MLRVGPFLIVLGVAACAGAPAPETKAPAHAPESSKPAASNTRGARVPSEVRIALEQARVSLNGRPFVVEPSTKLRRIEPLFAELKELHVAGAGPSYLLEVADGVTGLDFKSSFQTAAFAGWTVARWDAGPLPVTLKALVPAPPGAKLPVSDPTFPNEPLVVVVRKDGVDLHRLRAVPPDKPQEFTRDEEGQYVPVAEFVGQAPTATLDADLAALLARECTPERPCLPGVLYLENAADTSLVRRSLALIATAALSEHGAELQVRAKEPVARGEPLRVGTRIGPTTVSGRLPPEVIQNAVRKNYGAFRKCYEQGLARNPNLKGRVAARFVIGRDGKVSNVGNGGSDLPDPEVVSCVLKAFYGITFQPPEGGIVTVVYPIMLEPG